MASATTSIRLTATEKRAIAAAARKRGLSPTAFIKLTALQNTTTPDARLEALRQAIDQLKELVDDELDYRQAAAAWERHLQSGKPLLKSEEAWRALGV